MKLDTNSMNLFERKLTLWVALCIAAGLILGKVFSGFSKSLDGMAIMVNGAPVVSRSHRDLSLLHDVSYHGED